MSDVQVFRVSVVAGPGLVFVIYPEAFPTMPASQFFAFLFFFMLVCLSLDGQVSQSYVCI